MVFSLEIDWAKHDEDCLSMTNDAEQTELLQRLKAGDASAWSALFHQHAPAIWKFVSARMLGRAGSDVEDVVQETMLAAARSVCQFDSDRNTFSAWLTGIARNQVAQYFRREKRQDVSELAADELLASSGRLHRWINAVSEPHAGPEQLIITAEEAKQIQDTLNSLSDDYSFLLTAKYLEGHSTAQIALQLDATVDSVHSKLARARKAFREKFESTQVS